MSRRRLNRRRIIKRKRKLYWRAPIHMTFTESYSTPVSKLIDRWLDYVQGETAGDLNVDPH